MEDNELKAIQEAITTQATNNYPQIYIQDLQSGRVFEYGKNCHDRLVISEDGRSLHYENLQNGDGSCCGDYRFYYEKPKIETEMDKMHEWDLDHYARNVENKSLDKLAEFENFMEANKFEGIEELQKALNGEFEHIFDEKHKIWIKTIEDKTYVEKRNGILEERWQNLKEWLSIKWFAENADLSLGDVIRKIKELEKEIK